MVGIELDRLIVVLDGTVVLALSGVGVTTVIVGDGEGFLRLFARLDECGTPHDLRIGRCAIRAITQFDVLE
jgi:hypothetical protein